MVRTPVRSVIHLLNLVNYLSAQADNHALSFTLTLSTVCSEIYYMYISTGWLSTTSIIVLEDLTRVVISYEIYETSLC